MATATFTTRKDNVNAYITAVVLGDHPQFPNANVEYTASVPLAQLQGLTQAQIRAALLNAVQQVRANSLALIPQSQADLGISGTAVI